MNQITNASYITVSETTETCKSIIISIAGHLMAIPVNAVFKVIRSSLVYSSSLGENKIIHIEKQTLPLIDLHFLLTKIKPNNELEESFTSEEEKFLVLAETNTGKLVAIVVDEPPSLINLPLSNVYALPVSQQQSISNIANNIAIVPYKKSHLTVMLLDIQQALIAAGFVKM